MNETVHEAHEDSENSTNNIRFDTEQDEVPLVSNRHLDVPNII